MTSLQKLQAACTLRLVNRIADLMPAAFHADPECPYGPHVVNSSRCQAVAMLVVSHFAAHWDAALTVDINADVDAEAPLLAVDGVQFAMSGDYLILRVPAKIMTGVIAL